MHVVRLADRAVQRWRNGGGETRELVTGGATEAGGFAWRISVATIARDGPFSSFAGIDRSLLRLDGGSLALDIEGRWREVDPRAIRFAGEDRVFGRIEGDPVRVVNVMTDRAVASHRMWVGPSPADTQGATSFAIVLDDDAGGSAEWSVGDLLVDVDPALPPPIGRFAFVSFTCR